MLFRSVSTIFSPLHKRDTLLKHERRCDSAHTRGMSHLAKTGAVAPCPWCADFSSSLLFNVQVLKCARVATGGKRSYSAGNFVAP